MTGSALPLVAAGSCLAAVFAGLWWRQTRTRNATSVDAAWAIAIGALGVTSGILGDGAAVQRLVAVLLAGGWSLRLSWHLLRHRVLHHAGEDGRYRAMREHWGERANTHFFWFYEVQAAAALAFALPFWFLSAHPATSLDMRQGCGLAVVLFAQFAEAAADHQLHAHRADVAQRGLACRRGLWRYSRHPNYFFEWLSWCGIGLVTAPAAGWLALIQPVAMFVLVRCVSGVPFTELQALKSRGDDYRRYQQETNAFVPWWPKRPRVVP